MIKVHCSSQLYFKSSLKLDVPPLEDCSAFYTSRPAHEHSKPSVSATRQHERQQTNTKIDGGVAGMKKGFLNQQLPKKKKSSDDDIPFIKPSTPNTSSSLRFPEVQEAMKSPLLNSHGLMKVAL